MMNRNSLALLRPMILVFMLLNVLFISGKNLMAKWEIDQDVVIVGNLILFIVSLITFILSQRSLRSPNPNAFVRAMYTSFLIRFFICLLAAFIYIMSVKKDISKPALIICMMLYVIYTVIEVSSLTKLLRKKKNA